MNNYSPSLASFSLVEVVIALGVVSFCLVTLVGLLPMGLQSEQEARQYAAAASGVEKIANAIREATLANNQYQAIGAYTNLAWQIGGSPISETITNISLTGDPVTTSGPQLAAYVQINPPANPVSSGTALISIAWPNRATWNSSSSNWIHADGAVSTWLIFIPKS